MKIAFRIVAHDNIPQLNCFLRQLFKLEGSYVFIHLDKKQAILLTALRRMKESQFCPNGFQLSGVITLL
ncbi:MAG: hypothetical protein MJ168_07450 [Clostridia bacterium]|nr:hypothetical protein [Clostridia bacterium]